MGAIGWPTTELTFSPSFGTRETMTSLQLGRLYTPSPTLAFVRERPPNMLESGATHRGVTGVVDLANPPVRLRSSATTGLRHSSSPGGLAPSLAPTSATPLLWVPLDVCDRVISRSTLVIGDGVTTATTPTRNSTTSSCTLHRIEADSAASRA
jgi:hypothetical protein